MRHLRAHEPAGSPCLILCRSLVLNKRQLRLLTDFVSLDILEYSPFLLSAAHEAQDFAQDAQRLLAAFADLRITIGQLIDSPGRVALIFSLSGCNTGPLPWAAQPTLRHASSPAMGMLGIEGGRISEIRGIADRCALLQQLGLSDMAAKK